MPGAGHFQDPAIDFASCSITGGIKSIVILELVITEDMDVAGYGDRYGPLKFDSLGEEVGVGNSARTWRAFTNNNPFFIYRVYQRCSNSVTGFETGSNLLPPYPGTDPSLGYASVNKKTVEKVNNSLTG